MICEKCGISYEIKYGSGRFCSKQCARSFSSYLKRFEINEKLSLIMKSKLKKGEKIGSVKINPNRYVTFFCDICGKSYLSNISKGNKRIKTCSNECSKKLRIKSYNQNLNKNVGGYRQGSGRGKSGWYENYWCDSSYELAFVIYNIEHNILFERNKEGFEYYWNSKKHLYYPDFIINGEYIEIKGRETKQDIVKYTSIDKPLKILKRKNINHVFNYVIEKYGKDFIKLYTNNPHNELKKICKVCGKPCKNIYCSRKCAGKGNNINSKTNT